MTSYTLSNAADRDVQEIARNSNQSWGIDAAELYVRSLHRIFETLGQFPLLAGMRVICAQAIFASSMKAIPSFTGERRQEQRLSAFCIGGNSRKATSRARRRARTGHE